MTRAEGAPPLLDAAAVIARHLQSEDAVTRCLAAKALGHIGSDDAADALVAALMDPDPDVRADAMEALVTCARPQDAAHIRRSLIGDPVQEVKVAALRALAGLGDRDSIALIRRLALDRAEDTVSWEDAAGMWDDWLVVQIAPGAGNIRAVAQSVCAIKSVGQPATGATAMTTISTRPYLWSRASIQARCGQFAGSSPIHSHQARSISSLRWKAST